MVSILFSIPQDIPYYLCSTFFLGGGVRGGGVSEVVKL